MRREILDACGGSSPAVLALRLAAMSIALQRCNPGLCISVEPRSLELLAVAGGGSGTRFAACVARQSTTAGTDCGSNNELKALGWREVNRGSPAA
jgi:hypothetical protein